MAGNSISQADEEAQYAVVVNDEEQYSIWSAHRTAPEGWRQVGVTGTKQECLTHIEKVWTDMRPLSLRRAMGGERAA
jgi:MbtH protein